MSQVFMGNALWHLIMQSDAICQGVLVILLIISIISWALFFYKFLLFRKKRKEIEHTINQLGNVTKLEELLSLGYRESNTFGGQLLNKNLIFFKSLLETVKLSGRNGLNHEERELVREQGYQFADELVAHEEQGLPFLSGTAAAAPLLGLFGTVWGLIHAFIGITEKQSADIATVAPGIAEALITTLGGIAVAIPALVMFVYLNTMLKSIEQRCLTLVDRFSMIIHRIMHQ